MAVAPQHIRDLVIQDVMARSEPRQLAPHELPGDDVLAVSYEKALDLCIFLRAEMERRNRLCQRCEGSGKIANTTEGEPWVYWASLPIESQAAVRFGIIKPMVCPECNGTGLGL